MNLLMQDYLSSREKNLGSFALNRMHQYDDTAYELVIIDARNDKGHKITGSASGPSRAHIEEIIKLNHLQGDFYIRVVDCQKEFFCILAEIRDHLDIKTRERV